MTEAKRRQQDGNKTATRQQQRCNEARASADVVMPSAMPRLRKQTRRVASTAATLPSSSVVASCRAITQKLSADNEEEWPTMSAKSIRLTVVATSLQSAPMMRSGDSGMRAKEVCCRGGRQSARPVAVDHVEEVQVGI